MKHDPIARPSTRTARLEAVCDVLRKQEVSSQAELLLLLEIQGLSVTQATLSRDLFDLGATKERRDDGRYVYVIHEDQDQDGLHGTRQYRERQMSRVLSDLMVGVVAAQNLVVMHTPSGAAQYLASILDRQMLEGVLGTIAGDDTVLIVCADAHEAKRRVQWMTDLASNGKDN